MEKTGPHTKALQDIATQLKRIADYMEQHPRQNITIHVNEGATISGGITDIAEDIVNRPGIANAGSIVADNTESFNHNDGEAIKNLTSALSSPRNPGTG